VEDNSAERRESGPTDNGLGGPGRPADDGPGSGAYAPYQAAYTSSARPWRWLASTVKLQDEAYGVTPTRDVVTRAKLLKENLFAAIIELAEASREFSWKSWAHDIAFFNRDRLLEELVDVAHFIANMLVSMGVTDEEWEAAYQAKQAVNRQRQIDGYKVKEKP